VLHIVGIVGVPGAYGGFETLVEYLLDSKKIRSSGVIVYCERDIYKAQGGKFKGAVLAPLRWKANGWQSVLYDLSGLWRASRTGGTVLILGTSATFVIPILKILFPKCVYIVNMAGLEWSRSKWGLFARAFLKFNEKVAAKYSHKFITDNRGLSEYIVKEYNRDSVVIPYGGDQFVRSDVDTGVYSEFTIPEQFDFAMARAQIDNNIEIILKAFVSTGCNLVFVSNWDSTSYGKRMLQKYGHYENIKLIGPIYDVKKIKALHLRTRFYVHGHSAGGTNPVLVESMWAGLPILAYDVSFNRYTTYNLAFYFKTAEQLEKIIQNEDSRSITDSARNLFEAAKTQYKWEHILNAYEKVIFEGETI
jgi:glycosyltransferase involved in cell wall biosynthesis